MHIYNDNEIVSAIRGIETHSQKKSKLFRNNSIEINVEIVTNLLKPRL